MHGGAEGGLEVGLGEGGRSWVRGGPEVRGGPRARDHLSKVLYTMAKILELCNPTGNHGKILKRIFCDHLEDRFGSNREE